MPFTVQCACGQRFMAQDWLAGKTVACPACGYALPVVPPPAGMGLAGAAQPAPRQDAGFPASGLAASRQPVPGVSPSGGTAAPPPPDADGPAFGTGLKVVVAVGVAAVALLLIAIFARSFFARPDPEIARETAAAKPSGGPAAGRVDPPSVPSSPREAPQRFGGPLTPAPKMPDPSLPERAAAARRRIPPDVAAGSTRTGVPFGVAPTHPARPGLADRPARPATSAAGDPAADALPAAIARWHTATGALSGSRPVPQKEAVILHYSWMCELLPFLGHEKEYNQLDFRQPWTHETNVPVATVVVPAFLNPADDRRRWTGAQFHDLALSHFVGLSGVEDRRMVVAAALPRSDPRAGVFGYDQVARREEITDGLSQTIMLAGSGEVVAPWIQGGGATVRGARAPYFDPLTGFGSRGLPSRGSAVLMADGSTHHLSADIDPAVFRALVTIHGGETVDAARLGPPIGRFPGTK